MAHEIFTNITEITDQVGGAINRSMEIDSIGPHIGMAAHKHLVLWLGITLWDNLVSYVDNPSPVDTDLDDLLPYARKPLAFLTLEEYAKIGSIQFGEAGMYRTETDTHKGAYKYQENNYRQSMLENGYEALEQLLDYLEANEVNYPDWQASSGYTRNKSLVINSAATFRDRYSRSISRHTFEMLRPLIEDLEFFVLVPIMGEDQYDDVKTNIADKTTTGKDLILLGLIQKAIAYFTIQEGIRRHWLQIKDNRIIQAELLEPQSSKKEAPASTASVNLATRHNDEFGNRFVSRMLQYLDDNIDDFTSYKTWKEAKEAAEEAEADDADYERFASLTCGCAGSCSCPAASSNNSIIRL